jgi:iron complex transport system substrate-binding protein
MRGLTFSLLLCLAACGGDGASASKGAAEPKAAAGAPTKARTFASTILLADDALWALGPEVRARTVAVSALADDPRYSESVGQWPKDLPRVGPNPAEIVALRPDVVFLASFSDQAYRAALAEHFELVVLESFSGFEDYRKNLRTIGSAVGESAEVEKVIADFDRRLAELESKRPPNESTWPTCVSYESGYVAGANTSFDDAARAAGCRNLVSKAGVEGHAAVDTEQLVAWAPDYLVVSCAGPESADCERREAQLREMAGINTLAAVAEGRVIAVHPAQLSSVGEGMLELTSTLASSLRPR